MFGTGEKEFGKNIIVANFATAFWNK